MEDVVSIYLRDERALYDLCESGGGDKKTYNNYIDKLNTHISEIVDIIDFEFSCQNYHAGELLQGIKTKMMVTVVKAKKTLASLGMSNAYQEQSDAIGLKEKGIIIPL